MVINQNYVQAVAALLKANVTLLLQTITNYKGHTSKLINLLTSTSSASHFKTARKRRSNRKPKQLWIRPGRMSCSYILIRYLHS